MSELNVSANDLEELPSSIGLLRHVRTLYADENFLLDIPPEVSIGHISKPVFSRFSSIMAHPSIQEYQQSYGILSMCGLVFAILHPCRYASYFRILRMVMKIK